MSIPRPDHMASTYASHHSAAIRNHSHSPSSTPTPPTADSSSLSSARSPFSLSAGINNGNGIMPATSRSGSGSPSHDLPASSRLFSKRLLHLAPPSPFGLFSPPRPQASADQALSDRAREIQAQEGIASLPSNPWGGPPTSGNSTPLRENIPESPTDGFPDFSQLPTPDSLPHTRRARAGTVPSRFSPGGPSNGLLGVPGGLAAKSARATPSQSPFNKSPSPSLDPLDNTGPGPGPGPGPAIGPGPGPGPSVLLSRLRAGSMPQRSHFSLPGSTSPFGPSIFTNWNPAGVGRDRASTLASIASVGSNGPSSPSQSHFSRDGGGDSDVHMRTLDYLGLAETPQPPRAQLVTPYLAHPDYTKQSSRFRSYSVNNKDKYADDDDDDDADGAHNVNDGAYDVDGLPIDGRYAAALQDQLAATNAAIRSHNLAVQAFASQASATRPRARTAGVLETPGGRLMRTYLSGSSVVPNPISTPEMHVQDEKDYDDLPQAMAGVALGRSNSLKTRLLAPDDQGVEGPTSALWLGGIPTSTTTSTLVEMFKPHGPVLSARVLTHKNCGFVNFERIENAISAKASMSGKEIFPGAGPVRINFAKPPSASGTPGHEGTYPSPSPDPFSNEQEAGRGVSPSARGPASKSPAQGRTTPTVPPLCEMVADILEIVGRFGASGEEKALMSRSLESAIEYNAFVEEIPPIREPAHTRVHDAPRLRDIRKRIDNQLLSQQEIEAIAMDMLPEIAELSSDYLGNTVVQKLFEHSADPIRDLMLAEIAPHMAEIGVHKNGTWAAQKIIDVCKTTAQMTVIVEHLRPFTVPLFLDQYGNYVLQCCLKFGTPYNEFIFETMLSRMWEIAQGRFGARAMRACLESHHATKDQQRMLAAAIALHSVQLTTSANGALLLTWLLDTCTFPHRRSVLSPRLVPYLVHMCTHKVAYLTVLKVINQRAEPDARDLILRALFFSPDDEVLEAILSDHACGATLIFKVLTTPFFDDGIRGQVMEKIKDVLVKIKAQPNQGYKRLMDEVGLATRVAGAGREAGVGAEQQRQRPASRHGNAANGHHGQQAGHGGKAFYNPLMATGPGAAAGPGYEAAGYGVPPRTDGPDGTMTGYRSYAQGPMCGLPAGPMAAGGMGLQPMQYAPGMMARAAPQINYSYAPMQPGYGPALYGGPGPGTAAGSPLQPTVPPVASMAGAQSSYMPPGFGMPIGGLYGYGAGMGGAGGGGGGGGGGVQLMGGGYVHQETVVPRRGRPRQGPPDGRPPRGGGH